MVVEIASLRVENPQLYEIAKECFEKQNDENLNHQLYEKLINFSTCEKDKQIIFDWATQLAEFNHNSYAQYLLSKFHMSFFERDFEKSFEWAEKSYQTRNPFAAYHLGEIYEQGNGVKKDISKAIEYFKESSNLGNTNAMIHLALFYKYGNGVEKNLQISISYFKKAAALGSAQALNNLAFEYQIGNGVERDNKKAIELFQKAADLGHTTAITTLENFQTNFPEEFKRLQTDKEILLFLLCAREFATDSLFFKDNLPLEILKIILQEADICSTLPKKIKIEN